MRAVSDERSLPEHPYDRVDWPGLLIEQHADKALWLRE
jgi:hypothetical protein